MSSIFINDVEHAAASGLKEIHACFAWAKKELPKIEAAAPVAEAIVDAIAPKDVALTRAAFACLGKVIAFVDADDKEAQSKLGFDPDFVADIKTITATFKSVFSTKILKP